MFNIETTDAIGAERYVDVDWKGIGAIDGHPLDFLIARGISVYYKVHRGDFFVSRHQWQPVVPGSAKEIAGLSIQAVDYSIVRRDTDLLLLRLDEEDLREIRATGTRGMIDFSLGGLALSKPKEGDSGDGARLTELDFHRAHVVRHERWKHAQNTAPIGRPPRHVDYAESLWIGYEDLYLENSDIAELKKCGTGMALESYPLAVCERAFPPVMEWLYKAAYACNRDKAMEPLMERGQKPNWENRKKAIQSWLRIRPGEPLFGKRWMRTAVTLVPREYKFAKNFKEEWLEKPAFQKGRALRSEHLSTMLTLALALTEWWLDQDGGDLQAKRIELAGLLEDAGFGMVAVEDLTGMITGEEVTDGQREAFLKKLEAEQTKKKLSRAIQVARSGGGLSGGQRDVGESSGDPDPFAEVGRQETVGDSEKVYVPRNLGPRI
ncbi:hypothetical protein QSH46_016120 [Xanthomonas arboricola pv. juglandis]|uniref:hypothetical protein n=1 Tax=Xanthomonas arboricola TaxID=56448 RepID=UPI0002D2F135|nr:hypothetical protein [Xanthomonas arboricola]MDN0221587.1 hypothetical protein [Xanthomonas arboricola pv. juglandis]MDN0225861.1 hypothetical protein [Xanthomonas arboricola pv. juglandis]MDN0229991.1 hypothetical protein [Xanthomonas arboricola pv. juglandis]MDN0234343.1 hypothetical protein [Xanthomonas arboricola pv. juglandis]MDN0238640.1 hypothetical protein [Xanthomonas arboricola pv. juglandis]